MLLTSRKNTHMKKNLSEIGKRIKKARKSKGISQVEFADKLDISVSHLSNIENGKINVGLDIFLAKNKSLSGNQKLVGEMGLEPIIR